VSGADVGLFYYAGHGLQVDQRNFLAPVDAQLNFESDLDFEAVELDLVLKQMVRNAPTSIVFLDACRDNPLAANLAQSSRSLDVGRSLARVEAAASMMIVYSTEPGKVAMDGTGRNSPFTAALLQHIDTEGASISDVMIAVRNDVLKATGGKQRPFESASLTSQFFFKPAAAATAADTSSETSAELTALRQEITRLQADQGALLKSQQEQLELLQKKLAEETKTSEQARQQPGPAAPAATNRVIAVEPAASGAAAPANASANGPAPPTAAAPPPADTKIAAAESKGAEVKEPEAVKATEPPLPGSVAREEVAQDILAELKRLGCYFGRVNGNWSVRSQLALERFNRLSALELPLDEPQQASLDAPKAWKGPHCPIERAVGPRARRPPEAIAVPKQQIGPAHKGIKRGRTEHPSPSGRGAKPETRASRRRRRATRAATGVPVIRLARSIGSAAHPRTIETSARCSYR